MEVVGYDRKDFLLEVVDNHVVEDPTDHEEIVIQGFGFYFWDEGQEGVVREGSSEFPYLLILIKLWPGNFKTQLKRINYKVDEDNGKVLGKGNVRYRKIRRFSSNDFWKNIGCLISAPTFGLGGSRLWEKEE